MLLGVMGKLLLVRPSEMLRLIPARGIIGCSKEPMQVQHGLDENELGRILAWQTSCANWDIMTWQKQGFGRGFTCLRRRGRMLEECYIIPLVLRFERVFPHPVHSFESSHSLLLSRKRHSFDRLSNSDIAFFQSPF